MNNIITTHDLRKSFPARGNRGGQGGHGEKGGEGGRGGQVGEGGKGGKGGRITPCAASASTSARGEIFGFLGPNGAGKTTTLRMLTTLLPIDSGTATVAGFDVARQPKQVRTRIGYVSQLGGADELATGRENLILQGRLYGASQGAGRAPRGRPWSSCSTSPSSPTAGSRPTPAASAGGSTSRSASCTSPRCCSSTSRRPGSTRRAGRTCGITSAAARARHHGVPHHPLPGGGRRALRPADDHGSRADRRRGHSADAQAAGGRRRDRDQPAAGRRRNGQGPSAPPRCSGASRTCGSSPPRRPGPAVRRRRRHRAAAADPAAGRRAASGSGRSAMSEPTLDDVFLRQTGRSLRDAGGCPSDRRKGGGGDEAGPRYRPAVPAVRSSSCCATRCGCSSGSRPRSCTSRCSRRC